MVDGFREGYDTVRTFFQDWQGTREFYPFLQRAAEGSTFSLRRSLVRSLAGLPVFGGALIELTDFFEKPFNYGLIGETIARICPDGSLQEPLSD